MVIRAVTSACSATTRCTSSRNCRARATAKPLSSGIPTPSSQPHQGDTSTLASRSPGWLTVQPRTRRSTARPLLLARVDGLHAERHLTVAVLTKRPASYAAPERELITLMRGASWSDRTSLLFRILPTTVPIYRKYRCGYKLHTKNCNCHTQPVLRT